MRLWLSGGIQAGSSGERVASEILFLDSPDLILSNLDGERNLSFLPGDSPPGIVLGPGVCPNETLHPCTLLKLHAGQNLDKATLI